MNAKQIRRQLIDIDWTLGELAEAIGIKPYALSKILNGTIPLTKENQQKIALAFFNRQLEVIAD